MSLGLGVIGCGSVFAGPYRAMIERLDGWVASGAPVRVESEGGDGLGDRRAWVCELPEGTVRIACGGTHLTSLAELSGIRPSFALVDDGGTAVLEMVTEARPQP